LSGGVEGTGLGEFLSTTRKLREATKHVSMVDLLGSKVKAKKKRAHPQVHFRKAKGP